jgi:hypothetical protein
MNIPADVIEDLFVLVFGKGVDARDLLNFPRLEIAEEDFQDFHRCKFQPWLQPGIMIACAKKIAAKLETVQSS